MNDLGKFFDQRAEQFHVILLLLSQFQTRAVTLGRKTGIKPKGGKIILCDNRNDSVVPFVVIGNFEAGEHLIFPVIRCTGKRNRKNQVFPAQEIALQGTFIKIFVLAQLRIVSREFVDPEAAPASERQFAGGKRKIIVPIKFDFRNFLPGKKAAHRPLNICFETFRHSLIFVL